MTTIYPDVNARQKDYRSLAKNQLLVKKIFPTLQGEGPFSGQFAIFVRLAGCNLGLKESCPWCDTDFRMGHGEIMDVTFILAKANEMHRKNQAKLMVLTGGEPILQNPYLLVLAFLADGWIVQIETNGYFWSDDLHMLSKSWKNKLVTVISPKVNQRGVYPPIEGRLFYDSACLKIVVEADPESPYHTLPDYVEGYKAFHKPIYVSPIAAYHRQPVNTEVVSVWHEHTCLDRFTCRKNYRYAAQLAMQLGFRLSLQTHLFAELE